jgi:hypothetical protein
MAVTAQALVQELSGLEDGYWSGAFDSGDSNTIVDADFAEYSDGYFDGMWLRMTSGGESGEERRIQSFTKSTGTFELEFALSGAPSSTETFEVHRLLPPSKLLLALQDARLDYFPAISKLVYNAETTVEDATNEYAIPSAIQRLTDIYVEMPVGTAIVENQLPNKDFQSTDNLSVSQVTVTVLTQPSGFTLVPKYDNACVKADAALNQTATLDQTITTPANYSGIQCTFSLWVYCLTASRLTIQVVDTAGTESGDSHNGNGWQLLAVTRKVGDSNATLTARLSCSSGASLTYYVNRGWFVTGAREPNHFPVPLNRNSWRQFREIGDERVWIDHKPGRGRQLLMVGEGYVEDPTAYTTSINIGDPHVRFFAMAGLAIAYEKFAGSLSGMNSADASGHQAYWEGKVATKRRALGRKPRGIPLRRAV